MEDNWIKTAIDLSKSHVDWFLKTLRPLLIDHMVHGFKHGIEHASPHSAILTSDAADEEGRCFCPHYTYVSDCGYFKDGKCEHPHR